MNLEGAWVLDERGPTKDWYHRKSPKHWSMESLEQVGVDSASRLEAIASRVEAIASRLEAIVGRLEAIIGRLEAIASRVEAIASRVEAITSRVEEQSRIQNLRCIH